MMAAVPLHFHVGRLDEACALVVRHHYSHRAPSNIQCVGSWHLGGGLFGDYGEAVAACFFSIPPTRWSEEVLELSRLVRAPDIHPALTGLIAATANWIRRQRLADLLISFADATQGHHGGIYQEASWNYGGQRERSQDGLLIDGLFVPGRSCNSRFGTRSHEKLARMLHGHSVEPHWDDGKHIYWRALNRDGERKARRLELGRQLYPRPGMAIAKPMFAEVA